MSHRLEGFDEATYRRANIGVEAAIQRGEFICGLEHYLYFSHVHPVTGMVAGFDEARYLAANPDVSQAVASGAFKTGEQHFVLHGAAENRPGAPRAIPPGRRGLIDYCAPGIDPPPQLCGRVSHTVDPHEFHRAGRIIAFELAHAFAQRARLSADSRILDFGCGCGRVAQFLKRLHPASRLEGTDLDPEAIAWCRDSIPNVADFRVNAPRPPLPYPADHFDAVYSISVFTHLPEELERAWLAELARVTKPGGLLLLTTHGPDLFAAESCSTEDLEQFHRRGFVYLVGKETAGLPDFYRLSFHREDYLRQEWSKFFEIVDLVPQGIAKHQDIVVGRRRSHGA